MLDPADRPRLRAQCGGVRASRTKPNPSGSRNAYTGEIVDPGVPHDPSDAYGARRVKRLVLQEALAEKAPGGLIEFNKKLVGLEDLGKQGVRVSFEDGTERVVDLVVGADGIRSVCPLRFHLPLGHFTHTAVGAGGAAAHGAGLPPGLRM